MRIIIEGFPDRKTAEDFWEWFTNQGEQDYWEYAESLGDVKDATSVWPLPEQDELDTLKVRVE